MAQLSPAPKFAATFVDADGYTQPAVNYKLYTYLAGTNTPKDTYTSYTLGAANTNPVILDTRGEASVWLDGNYKLVLKDPADSTIWTVDDVRDLASNQTLTNMTLAGTLSVTSTAVTWSGNPTHSGNHTWSGTQSFNGNVAIGNASTDTLTVAPNAVTWSNNPTHSGAHTWSGAQTYSAAPLGTITSGTYTPTITETTNITSSTSRAGQYIRVGSVVHVSGNVDIDPTATGNTVFALSLPIASNFASQAQAGGVCYADTGVASGGALADATNDRVQFTFNSGSASASTVFYTFTYLIV